MTARVAIAVDPEPLAEAPVAQAPVAQPRVAEAPAPGPPAASPGRVHNLGPAARVLAGQGRTFWVEGREIAVFRDRRRQVFAAQAWCPHHFGSLGDGAVGYGEVICPLHGLRFDLRTGKARGAGCESIRTYPIRVSRDGDLLLTLR